MLNFFVHRYSRFWRLVGIGMVCSGLMILIMYIDKFFGLIPLIFLTFSLILVQDVSFSHRLKTGLNLIIVNLIIISSLLYTIEYGLKVHDLEKSLPFNGKQGDQIVTWGIPVRLNKYGFRDTEIPEKKASHEKRVMVVGDSLTWAEGVTVESRYTTILENKLNEQPNDTYYRVMNFGMRGASTVIERDYVVNYKDKVKPDLIIVGFCLNDPQPRGQNYSKEREEFDLNFANFFAGIQQLTNKVRLTYLGKAVVTSINRIAEASDHVPTWQEALNRTYDSNSQEWKDFVQALKDIKKMSDDMHLPPPVFAVLNQGTYTDRPTNYTNPDPALIQFLKWYHQAEQTATEIGFQTVNMEEELKSRLVTQPLSVNILDGHPSKELHAVYGQKLADLLLSRL